MSNTEFRFFEQALSKTERKLWAKLDSPHRIQGFLDDITYSSDEFYRCPLRVLRERLGHCFDGALFAAAALRRIGHPPLILEMLPNDRDDDHLLALYKVDGHWGALAKSNFVGLRFREPIHRTLRELALSYFEQYYNVEGEKTLRGYTFPLNLEKLDKLNWMTSDVHLEQVAASLDKLRRAQLVTPHMAASLSPVDRRSRQAGLAGSVSAGLFKPSKKKT